MRALRIERIDLQRNARMQLGHTGREHLHVLSDLLVGMLPHVLCDALRDDDEYMWHGGYGERRAACAIGRESESAPRRSSRRG